MNRRTVAALILFFEDIWLWLFIALLLFHHFSPVSQQHQHFTGSFLLWSSFPFLVWLHFVNPSKMISLTVWASFMLFIFFALILITIVLHLTHLYAAATAYSYPWHQKHLRSALPYGLTHSQGTLLHFKIINLLVFFHHIQFQSPETTWPRLTVASYHSLPPSWSELKTIHTLSKCAEIHGSTSVLIWHTHSRITTEPPVIFTE